MNSQLRIPAVFPARSPSSLLTRAFALSMVLALGGACVSEDDDGTGPDNPDNPDVPPEVTPGVLSEHQEIQSLLPPVTLRGTRWQGNATGDHQCSYPYSHYEATGDATQLHVVGNYTSLEGPGGTVSVHITRPGSSVLWLTAYEETNWEITVDPGVTIDRVITSGYYTQTVSAPAGVPIDSVIDSSAAGAHEWPSYRATDVVEQAEAETGLTLTSFRGCYETAGYVIADPGSITPPNSVTNQTEPTPIPGCESLAQESAMCLVTDMQSAHMIGLDSGQLCGAVQLSLDAFDISSLGWDGDYLYGCSFETGIFRISLVDGSTDVAPVACIGVTNHKGGLLAIAPDGDPSLPATNFMALMRFDSFADAAQRQPSHVYLLDPFATRLAAHDDEVLFAWHSTDFIETAPLMDNAPITPLPLAGYDDWIMGLDKLDDGRLVIGASFAIDEHLILFDGSNGTQLGSITSPDLFNVGGVKCASNSPSN